MIYSMLGMALILLSSNMEFVTKQLNTDVAGITFLISIEGLVRSATVYISGRLSDKFGRKQILCLSPIFEVIFLIGIPFVHDYRMAVVLSVFAGLSHAFVDSSSYPSLMECFPKTPGTATVIIKAFVAIGGIMLPIIIAFFVNRNMFYGNTFFLIAIMYLINGLFLFTRKFPKANQAEVSEDGEILNQKKFISEPVLKKEGLTIIIIGFTLIGLSSAGVLQMAQTTMGELFWKNKGATMGMVSTAGGIASAVVPALTGIILKYYDILHVFYYANICSRNILCYFYKNKI